jgi:hypothetical protein
LFNADTPFWSFAVSTNDPRDLDDKLRRVLQINEVDGAPLKVCGSSLRSSKSRIKPIEAQSLNWPNGSGTDPASA